MALDLRQEQQYSNPTMIFGEDYAELQSFFQYYFPPRRLSPQSWGLQENLADAQKDDLYNKMLTSLGMTEQDILFSSTYALINSKDFVTIQQMCLSDSTFVVDRRKGFSQISPRNKNRIAEHKLSALSRRFRDAFAHGRIGCYGDYVLYEDLSENKEKGTQTITGRIVLKKDDLKTWKGVIEQYIADNGIVV